MKMLRTLTFVLASVSFIIVIGGATYEHLAVVPVWSSAPPASLAMFQGEYALRAGNFWIPIHPLTLLLFTIALVMNWRTARIYILAALCGYLPILVATFFYFVPELMSITGSTFSQTVNTDLVRRAKTWEILSLVRLGLLILLAVTLLFGLSKSGESRETLT